MTDAERIEQLTQQLAEAQTMNRRLNAALLRAVTGIEELVRAWEGGATRPQLELLARQVAADVATRMEGAKP